MEVKGLCIMEGHDLQLSGEQFMRKGESVEVERKSGTRGWREVMYFVV